jgi:hypothetical protein
MAQETFRPHSRDFLSPGLIVLALAGLALWPGDASWLLDEPRLIATAWHGNHDWHLAVGGLYGNFGIRYGPLPTQVYQALLLFTHNPFALVVLRALLCGSVTGFSLLWLARNLELPGWLAAAILVSPCVAAYQRVLWDASFAMPMGTLALASFADFVRTGRAWPLRVCLLAAVLVPTIHPQALPLAVPILGWLAWKHHAELRRDVRALLVCGGLVLLFNGFYFAQFAGQLFARLGGSMHKGYPGGGTHLASMLAPLLGGHLLSGADYLENLARPSLPEWLHAGAQVCALLVYPLEWLGIGVAAHAVWRAVRRGGPFSPTAREAFLFVLLTGLGLQAMLFGAMRIPAAPQYFFGTFALHAVAAMCGAGALRKWGPAGMVGALYAAGAVLLTVEATMSIHLHGYEFPLWPTLSSSVRVARDLNRFSDPSALNEVAVYQRAPQALRTLRLLLPPAPGTVPERSGRLLVKNTLWKTGKPGETTLVEVAPNALPAEGRATIDITALPKDWVPDPSTW